MSILIRGMDMPKSCTECGCEQEGFWCGVLEDYTDTKYFDNKRHPNCPLIPVPPHGRLIDIDAPYELRFRLNGDRSSVDIYAGIVLQAEEGVGE